MRHLLGYLAIRFGVGLIGLMPAGMARALGRAGGRVWHKFASGRRAMAERHMRRVRGPDVDAADSGREVMVSYGRYWAEALWARADRVPQMMEHTRVDGLERLLAASRLNKGTIVALPHMGNWEAAAPIAVSEGLPLVAVAEKLANPRITDWFTSMRAQFGIEIVLATGGIQVMRQLETALAENKVVALLSDRDLKGKGVEVEFFGEVTTLPPGPATLAMRTGAPLLPVGCYFTNDGHHVVIDQPIPMPEGPRSGAIQSVTQELAHRFEDLIRKDPEQWHLVQPNWPSDRVEQ